MSEYKYTTLTTEYMEQMDKDMPWAEYPRPSMVRDSYICLNGEWDFCVSESTDLLPTAFNEKILVPFPPESPASGIERNMPDNAFLHYRRSFAPPDGFNKGRVLLHFGAVDNICEVYVNEAHAVSHDGGYLPFSADITDLIRDGENEIYVKVRDDLSGLYPYGKQKKDRGGMWYTPVSGIWQTVWLESVPEKYIKSIKVTPTAENVKIEVIGGDHTKRLSLDGAVYEFEGSEIVVSPIDKHLWTPETPYLYNFTLESGDDKVNSYFALREIGIKNVNGIPRITLNGKPYLFNGLLDQGYYPDGIFLPATSYGYEEDIVRIKKLGFNMLRKHIKVEPEVFYNLCDRLGVVVFQDMVNNSDYSFFIDTALPTIGLKRLPIIFRHRDKKEREIFTRDMYGTMDHLHFFPSVMYYTIFNEGWGQFCADKMYDKAKAHDPSRIIDATSGWFWRTRSDVDSRHVYFKKVKIGHLGKKPIVISEFGGYAHRVEGHLFGEGNYGYNTYESREEFENLFDKLYTQEIEPLIAKGICALVYTQVSDVEDETNGLMTYDRRVVKLGEEKTKGIMAELYKKINN